MILKNNILTYSQYPTAISGKHNLRNNKPTLYMDIKAQKMKLNENRSILHVNQRAKVGGNSNQDETRGDGASSANQSESHN